MSSILHANLLLYASDTGSPFHERTRRLIGELAGGPDIVEQDRFWDVYQGVAADVDARGNLVTDAHLVSLMIENGVRTIWTHDRDYRKFRGIEVRDPFE